MSRKTKLKLLLLLFSTGIGVAMLEIAARLLVHSAQDGNLYYKAYHLKPYRLPVQHITKTLDKYLSTTNSGLIYDPDLGWSPRPGTYNYNSAGIWSAPQEFATNRPDDRLRIALFGGSYTQGGKFESGWGRVLEKELNAAGVKAEVLNFGVPGYSMDQSFLRWRKHGRAFHPHIVVFGFNGGYCRDNLNMIRPFQHPGTEIPFLKPRFILENGQLQLINTPTPAPQEIPALIRNIDSWPLLSHEAYYDPADYRLRLLWQSRFISLLEAKLNDGRKRRDTPEFYHPGWMAGSLALAILRQFQMETKDAQAEFWIMDLPDELQLRQFARGGVPYDSLLAVLSKEMRVVRAEGDLLARASGKELSTFFIENHYRDEFEQVIGRKLAAELRQARQR